MLDATHKFDPTRPIAVGTARPDPAISLPAASPAVTPGRAVPAASTPGARTPIKAAASTPATTAGTPVEESRYTQQQRYVANAWKQLGQDARLAAVMFNPLFMVQAQAISDAAVATAFRRYEYEVPRKDFSVLYNEETARARIAILAMPAEYERLGAQALQATGQALLDGYEATASGVATVAEVTATAAKDSYHATLGVFARLGRALSHGIGHLFHGLGDTLTGAGTRLERVGS